MNIWVPKFKIIEPPEFKVPRLRMQGRYQLRSYRRDGVTPVAASTWFDNLILNQGLDLFGAGESYLQQCSVGTGTGTPGVTDTALGSLVAATTTLQDSADSNNGSSPYGATISIVKRFAEGVAEGNLTEVGIGDTSEGLFSRALILDGMGSPTTFPVASDEVLDVAYELTFYPPLDDVEDSVTITGSGSHDYVARTANVGAWEPHATRGLAPLIDFMVAHSGGIGAITGAPSGTTDNATSSNDDAYTPGSYLRTCSATWGLTDGNVGDGIAAVRVRYEVPSNKEMQFQTSFSPDIPKDGTKVLTLNYSVSWARSA